jgi:hypothetical protein
VVTPATLQIKNGPGFLDYISMNGGAATVINIYDSNTATTDANKLIAVLTTQNNAQPNAMTYEVPFNYGLYISATGIADFTIAYE